MPQSHAQIWLHVVFSMKERRPFMCKSPFREEMFRMLSFHTKDLGCISGSVGGHEDHVHLLVGLSRMLTVAQLVEHVKTETSKWAKKADGGTPRFRWQAGYGAFSVSHSMVDRVDEYIRQQESHHAKMTFQEEYRKMCERHGIAIDERYVWD